METIANNMELACREENGGIVIERARTGEKRAAVPEELFGLPVRALGPRAFAPRAGEHVHRDLHTVSLPPTLEQVGDYAFYNCVGLETIALTGRTRNWGASCLMNCRVLRRLELEALDEGAEPLCYFAGELPGELDVSVSFPDGDALRLIFPEYVESYENNDPAHHFDFHLYGPGFPYHNAFRSKRLDLALFDGAWGEMLRRQHDPACAMRLAFYRLRYPKGLSDTVSADYRSYLDGCGGDVLRWLVEEGDCRGLGWFLEHFRPGGAAVSDALELARTRRVTEAAALLLAQGRERAPAGRSRRFDL